MVVWCYCGDGGNDDDDDDDDAGFNCDDVDDNSDESN